MTVLATDPEPPAPSTAEKVDPPLAAGPTGFDAQRSVELPEERGASERTYRNPDGTLTTRFYTEQINYRDKQGDWKPVDTKLVPTAKTRASSLSGAGDGPAWETESTASPVTFAATADAFPLVSMSVGDELSVGYGVQDARTVVGSAEESAVAYRDVRVGADLEFVAGGSSVKEVVVLKDAKAATEWKFPLSLKGLTASEDGHGGIAFRDAEDVVRATMPAGWMQDSAATDGSREGEVSSGVTYRLSDENGAPTVTMTLDAEWLHAPERVFPVRVDPSLKSFDATSGTYVESPYNQSFASDTVLKTGTYDGGSHKAAAFLRFSGVESTLKNAWVVGANLALYNTWSQSCTARPVTIHPITSNWSESTTTKYPGPATGSSLASKSFAHGWRPEGTTTWSCGAAWENIKLGSAGRKLVDDWTHGRKKNYGLAVKASTSDSKGWKQFGSDDYPNGKPSLDVTWTKYGAEYRLGDFTAPVTATSEGIQKVTLTNRGQETWPKGGKYKLRYNLYDAKDKEITDSAKMAYTEMPEAVAPGDSVTVNAKIAPLDPATYTVQWTMTDYGVSRFTSAGIPGPAVRISAVNLPPQLTAESPAGGITVDTLTPTLWAKGEDADAYPKATLQYSFEVCEVEGSNTRANCRKGSRGEDQQWAVPEGWLSWDRAYAWYAYAYDGEKTSERPGPARLSTEVPQPMVTSHLGATDGQSEIGARYGNFNTSATDAALTTAGPELAVTRTYNSLDPRASGPFGTGWSTRWDMRVRTEPDSHTAVVTMADGTQVRFGRNADNSYTGPSGTALTLTGVGESWSLRDSKGTTYSFLPTGQLAAVMDASGRMQRLKREAEDGGDLIKVTDSLSGRSLDLTWSGGHVTSVTTNAVGSQTAGLTWTYTYKGDRLTRVCPPDTTTACTDYVYEDGSVYRSGVLDAAPTSYWRLGESEGSVAAGEAPSATGLKEGTYRDVTLGAAGATAGTTDTAVTFDGTDSVVELPASSLKAAAYPAIELWFKTTTASAVLVGFQEDELGQKPAASWRPVLNIDSKGKLRGEFRRTGMAGASGPVTSPAAVTNGAWHHAVLTADAAGQSLYLDGKKLGTIDGGVSDQARDYAYLGAGYTSTSWTGDPDGERHFKGQMDEVAFYDHPLDPETVSEHYAARTARTRLTTVTLPSGRAHAVASYDQVSGRLTRHTDEAGVMRSVSALDYTGASGAYADLVRGGKPTGYWRFGEHTGATVLSALDSGGDGDYLDGSRPGAPGVFREQDDPAASFDGSGSVEVPAESLGTGTDMSVELWFRTKKRGVLATMQNSEFGDTPTGWRPMLVIDADGRVRGKFQPDNDSLLSRTTVTDNAWHHVVLTGTADGSALYLDGRLQGQNAGPVSTVRHPHVFIGGGYVSSGWDGEAGAYRNFTGQIDEAAFYGRSLVPWVSKKPVGLGAVGTHYEARTVQLSGSDDQYRGVALADAPAAYWRLGEESGTALASTAGGVSTHATLHGNTTQLASTGVFGSGGNTSIELADKGYIETPADILAGAASLSVEMWFKTAQAKAVLAGFQEAPVGQTPAASWRPVLNIDADGKLRGEFREEGVSGAQGPITSGAKVTDDAWHHVVLSGGPSGQTLYLDGVKVGSRDEAISDQSRAYAAIGAGYASESWMGVPSGTYYLAGQLDEVALYRTALTAQQAAAHYRAQAETFEADLVASVKVTDPADHIATTRFDALRGGRLVSTTDPLGGLTAYAYDIGGNLHTVTDPGGHTTVTGHDKHGNTVSTTTCRDANSCWTSFSTAFYNEKDVLDPRNNLPLTVSDARSRDAADTTYRSTYTYTAQGQVTAIQRPVTGKETTTYTTGSESAVGGGTTPAYLPAKRTTAAGAVTAYRYHANGDLAEVTSPSGLRTRYTYDGLGRMLTETQVSDSQPEGVTTGYIYDERSQVVAETGVTVRDELTGTPHTARISRVFDADGNLLSESAEDAAGNDAARTTTYHYDAHGRNDSVTDPERQVTELRYNSIGLLSGTTDPAGNRTDVAYDAAGRTTTTTLRDWTGDPAGGTRDLVLESRAYDPAGRLASTTDAMGATTEYTYFDDGLPATVTAKRVTQADGSTHDIVLESDTYDAAGNLVATVTGNGTTKQTFTVDALGRPTSSTLDPAGLNRVATLAYDKDDRVTEQTETIDGSKRLTSTQDYDAAGNVIRQSVTDGTSTHTTTATYDQRGLPLTTVSPLGNVSGTDAAAHTTAYRYDALGNLVEQKSPSVMTEENGEGAVSARPTTRFGHNAFGEVTETEDSRGKTSTVTYDRLGRVVAGTLPDYTPPGSDTPLASTTRTTYNALGLAQTVTDPLGRVTRYGYDQLGNMTSRTDPVADAKTALKSSPVPGLLGAEGGGEGGVSRYVWTPTGLQLSATDPTGARTEATYDELGRQLTGTVMERFPDLRVLVSRSVWDDAGNLRSTTSPAGVTSTATYNPAGEQLTASDTRGTTRYAYDGLGRSTETVDATNRRTTRAYNALSEVTAVTDYGTGADPLRTTRNEYDVEGNRRSAVSAGGATTLFAYDALGRLTGQTEPVKDGETIATSFGHDAVGNLTRLTDGRGNETVYTFNAWNLPESTTEPPTAAHPEPVNRTWTTVYDKAGQAVTQHLPGGVTRHSAYDALGRLVHESGSGADASTTDRNLEYDLSGRMTASGGADSLTKTVYTYNDRGEVLTAKGPSGSAVYGYNDDGQMTYRDTEAGVDQYGYDNSGRLNWSGGGALGSDLWYDFDAAGRLTLEQYATRTGPDRYQVDAKRVHTYDALGRPATDTVGSADDTRTTSRISYGYDLDDQLVSKKSTGLGADIEESYTYDDSGRMTSWTSGSGTVAYAWDAAGNRTRTGDVEATYDARNRLLTQGAKTYSYTPRGTLASVKSDGSATRDLAFDAFERKVEDGGVTSSYDSLDRVQRRGDTDFTYDGGSNDVTSDGTSTYSRTPEGLLFSWTTDGESRLALTDQHTDVIAGLTPDGTKVTSSTGYDPFGMAVSAEGTSPAVGYQSGWTDPDNGDVNMASRWYSPETGGFDSRDTWQLDATPSGQANRYSYGLGSPVNGTDPNGHCIGPVLVICGIALYDLVVGGVAVAGGLAIGGSIHNGVKNYKGNHGSLTSGGSHAGSYGPFGSVISSNQSMVDSINAQADAMRRQASKSSGKSSRGSRGGRGGGGGYGGGYGGGGGYTGYVPNTAPWAPTSVPAVRIPVRPPAPPIDQNPNNGPHPVTAPARPTPKPDWDPKNGGWKPGDVIDMVVGALKMLNAGDEKGAYQPHDQGTYETAAGNANGNGSRDDDPTCRRGGEGWVRPSETDAEHGNRAVGIEACLDSARISSHPGSPTTREIRPPGYQWLRRTATYHQNSPRRFWVNNCHLLGSQLGGNGQDLRNLATCSRSANSDRQAETDPGNPVPPMSHYEDRVRSAIDSGEIVYYRVTPVYEKSRTVPKSFDMLAEGMWPDGSRGIDMKVSVPNLMYSNRTGAWINAGTVTHLGVPVPTDSMR
ncbi:LamG-like jellyroll fold domain-containing protein [Streptomyces sp. SID11385]|uniref:LamG-like jellyroll fold domain-containing protein n=1 Tax=Streptomyces sp. SID11385 TaxID=2706031 RepID=UPI0031BA009F